LLPLVASSHRGHSALSTAALPEAAAVAAAAAAKASTSELSNRSNSQRSIRPQSRPPPPVTSSSATSGRRAGSQRGSVPPAQPAAGAWAAYTRVTAAVDSAAKDAPDAPAAAAYGIGDVEDGVEGRSASASGQLFDGCSKEEYLRRHVDFHFQDVVRRLQLPDVDLYRLGKCHFQDQPRFLRGLRPHDEGVEVAIAAAASGRPPPGAGPLRGDRDRGSGGGFGHSNGRDDKGVALVPLLDDEETEVNPFWWRSEVDSLCFDLPMCSEEQITDSAPVARQWWDVEKLAESDHFVAISKPAGMFVVTDQRGLWEVSTTNFIHVAHQRFEMPSHNEPRQRGICHRLDSHTSGVQIFGKSWDAFRHFTGQNSSHRVQKEYLALVAGRLGPPDGPEVGLVDVPMKKWQDFDRREFGSVICVTDGLPAVTKYRALRQFWVPATGQMRFWGEGRWFTLVQLRILTGRTHQIRVHMAFIGYPLIGDSKYSPQLFEQDAAISPRIFLHCLRMEFEDRDGSMFIAASDLAPDLQASLGLLESLAREALDPQQLSVEPKSEQGGFSGLDKLLVASRWASPPDFVAADLASSWPRLIYHQCKNCRQTELARCTLLQRGKRSALLWTVTKIDDSQEEKEIQDSEGHRLDTTDSIQPTWGPALLWVPTGLREELPQLGEFGLSDVEDAGSDELGEDWIARGTEWAWAHNGSRQNGWIRLLKGGLVGSKWGAGNWKCLHSSEPPLLLVTFKGVEHALRLNAGGFDMVAKRRLNLEGSLADSAQNGDHVPGPDSPACCPTRGWPCPCPGPDAAEASMNF